MEKKIVIIGGGPAGLAAACKAFEEGVSAEDILIIERDRELGGILNQCIHAGFGLHMFGEELTGPEYAARYIDKVIEYKIPYTLDSMVIDITAEREVSYVCADGLKTVKAGAIILAMGCRERTRGALNIPGSRPSGVFSAGTAQRFVNVEGYMVGKKVVILGSGDIGLIMARRLTLEGAKVECVCELMPYSGGLARNIAQCLDDFGIPLYLSTTVVNIKGKERVEGVTIAKVDENRRPIPETARDIDCDTILLSVGLVPENELSKNVGITLDGITGGAVVDQDMQTSMEGIFACGNVLHVHDLVDYVSLEAAHAAKSAVKYLEIKKGTAKTVNVTATDGVRYTVPQKIDTASMTAENKIFMRVANIYKNKSIYVKCGDTVIKKVKRPHLAPGEMEVVKFTTEETEMIKNINADITVGLE
ncbi:MAG: pyridine nucleotide-disulfide oxidoreductase [Ruminococcaceae bacterium]|nr:pyridine nucleotide-disulfide oxidoreductase [Oscillospiraceae bacterium]